MQAPQLLYLTSHTPRPLLRPRSCGIHRATYGLQKNIAVLDIELRLVLLVGVTASSSSSHHQDEGHYRERTLGGDPHDAVWSVRVGSSERNTKCVGMGSGVMRDGSGGVGWSGVGSGEYSQDRAAIGQELAERILT